MKEGVPLHRTDFILHLYGKQAGIQPGSDVVQIFRCCSVNKIITKIENSAQLAGLESLHG